MQKKYWKQWLSCILCIVLIVAMALVTTGCSGSAEKQDSRTEQTKDPAGEETSAEQGADRAGGETSTEQGADRAGEETSAEQGADRAGQETSVEQTENGVPESGAWPDGSVIGEGSKQFTLTVTDAEGSETKLEIHTDAETVGAALSELGVIGGDEGEYGLFVRMVNGLTADYDKDGMYWALYVHDEYAKTGVDSIEITEGESYSFKMEKA